MTKTLLGTVAAIAAVTSAASAAPVGFTIGGANGDTLVRFDVDNPSDSRGIQLTGDAASLDAIAYRPRTRQLYGFDEDTRAVYLIDTKTGNTTFVASTEGSVGSDVAGFDFNNLIDAARIVGNNRSNTVFFPSSSSTAAFTDLFYAPGDPNAGLGPNIVANGYTNQIAFPDSTVQYGLDSEWNNLVTIANNAGTLETVAEITLAGTGTTLDFGANAGMDIYFNDQGQNVAYALLDTFQPEANGIDLYVIDLITGEATAVGPFSNQFGQLTGLAVFDPVPIPGAVVLFGSAAAAFGAVRRRRNAGKALA